MIGIVKFHFRRTQTNTWYYQRRHRKHFWLILSKWLLRRNLTLALDDITLSKLSSHLFYQSPQNLRQHDWNFFSKLFYRYVLHSNQTYPNKITKDIASKNLILNAIIAEITQWKLTWKKSCYRIYKKYYISKMTSNGLYFSRTAAKTIDKEILKK